MAHQLLKGSSDPSHFILETNVGKCRIRHTTTLQLNDEFQDRLKIYWKFKFKIVLFRIRLFPTLILKIKWLGSELPLTHALDYSEIMSDLFVFRLFHVIIAKSVFLTPYHVGRDFIAQYGIRVTNTPYGLHLC